MDSDLRKKNEFFAEMFSLNYRHIMSFIYTLVPNSSDADDIMQETARVMWEKIDQFEVGTNFVSWALSIAKYQVLSYRKKYHPKVPFNTRLIETLSQEVQDVSPRNHMKLDALRQCLQKLNQRDRKLIFYRFEKRFTAKLLAQQLGVAMNTIYRNESRILDMLLKCIQKSLKAAEL
jgi:RNA polymerase sigma-70 factor (ECF subfamily)